MWFLVLLLITIIIYQRFHDNNSFFKKDINIKENINYSEKYEKKEYLLTQTELKFYKILKSITDEINLKICPQVALYEIVKNKNFKDFNKIASKTIDFVVCEQNLKILLCIELDDYTHNRKKRIERDNFLNNIFKEAGIKLIRIKVQNFYKKEELKKIIIENIK